MPIIFDKGSVPVVEAAKIYGKDPSWVRAGLIFGWLPIGFATKNGKVLTDYPKESGRINYYISPKKLWEDTGYVWKRNATGSIEEE